MTLLDIIFVSDTTTDLFESKEKEKPLDPSSNPKDLNIGFKNCKA